MLTIGIMRKLFHTDNVVGNIHCQEKCCKRNNYLPKIVLCLELCPDINRRYTAKNYLISLISLGHADRVSLKK